MIVVIVYKDGDGLVVP